jgi:hypothetical protein
MKSQRKSPAREGATALFGWPRIRPGDGRGEIYVSHIGRTLGYNVYKTISRRRNNKSFRPAVTFQAARRKPRAGGKAREFVYRAMSSGISANILDSPSAKACPADMPGRKPACKAGGGGQASQQSPRRGRDSRVNLEKAHGSLQFEQARRTKPAPETCAGSHSGSQVNELEIRNPACDESDVREGARGKARGPGLRPDFHRSHGCGPLQSGEGLA